MGGVGLPRYMAFTGQGQPGGRMGFGEGKGRAFNRHGGSREEKGIMHWSSCTRLGWSSHRSLGTSALQSSQLSRWSSLCASDH